jgi:hypothetical protein
VSHDLDNPLQLEAVGEQQTVLGHESLDTTRAYLDATAERLSHVLRGVAASGNASVCRKAHRTTCISNAVFRSIVATWTVVRTGVVRFHIAAQTWYKVT